MAPHLHPGFVLASSFDILWAVHVGRLPTGRLSLPLRETPEMDLLGAQLSVFEPLSPTHQSFAEASVPSQPLLELRPYSASKL